MNLEELDSTVFENLIFDLTCDCGLINPIWRTPGSDEGRDIQGEFYISDLSGFYQRQVWYIECKRYVGSISWPLVWEKISYAETHNADILLFTNTSTITPQAQTQVSKWNESGKRPLIRIWNKIDILERLQARDSISIKYGLKKSSLQQASASLAPLVKLLIKSNDSLYASGLSSHNTNIKLELSHALGELLDKRISELEKFGKPVWRSTNANSDLYEWTDVGLYHSTLNLDCSALRAFLCYLKLCNPSKSVELQRIPTTSKELRLELEFQPEPYQLEHLRTISNWSNFSFFTELQTLTIQEAI